MCAKDRSVGGQCNAKAILPAHDEHPVNPNVSLDIIMNITRFFLNCQYSLFFVDIIH
jgi:hypothetical protein